jgi:rhodanese-related sulfurtransferase
MPRTITRDDLLRLLEERDDVTLVDALPASYYEQEHLPGAVNLVEADVDALAAGLLPDLERPVVTYCSNEACSNSKVVARRLEALGYTDVRTYAAGIQDWVAAGRPTESAVVA